MINKTLLGVLHFSGWFIFSTCLFHHYHYVPFPKTWSDAQTYCKLKYTDLATIENTTEIKYLISMVSFFGYNSSMWIGVYFNMDWTWAHTIPANYWNWENQTEYEPYSVYYACGCIDNMGAYYENCSLEHAFICDSAHGMVYVNESVDWFRAWRYCTENFTQLTTHWSSANASALVEAGKKAWFGWLGHPQIYWSDKSSSLFRYWDNFTKLNGNLGPICGVADLQRSGKWRLLSCNQKLPFVCHNISSLPIHLNGITVLRLRMSSPVDLIDSAVKADVLTQLQNRLQENGMSPVTLNWKIFHKDDVTNDDITQC